MVPQFPNQRDASFDIARGMCVVLVVTWHATLLTMQGAGTSGVGLSLDPWIMAAGAIGAPLRIPALMFIAGVFARAGLNKLGAAGFLNDKIFKIGYAAVLWLVIFAAARAFSPLDVPQQPLSVFMHELLLPTQPVWFIQQLFIFFALYALAGRGMIWIGVAALALVIFDGGASYELRRFAFTLHFFALGVLFDRRQVSAVLQTPA